MILLYEHHGWKIHCAKKYLNITQLVDIVHLPCWDKFDITIYIGVYKIYDGIKCVICREKMPNEVKLMAFLFNNDYCCDNKPRR